MPETKENDQIKETYQDKQTFGAFASGHQQGTCKPRKPNMKGCDNKKSPEGKGSNMLQNNSLASYGGLRYGSACLEWWPPEQKNAKAIRDGEKQNAPRKRQIFMQSH
eukprot:CAMPEP_0183315564 /NCGR_PEP_ID=MMETSP0160_2-20130417/52216_1 /TAXON_ID=2839 ORGANISM="Odontella Sinensis, Strain Grunow 1884" /NCGR_SAMPLE_ID=MMETSP0160_2 /ASSEMBLY_ACC=CAM_ASM_000250 /LENGTH=106 /DNA_ID=CAMNT_0025481155 /DNA_START=58 /DNA_END=375 /DNA_ORIENTATION=+